MPEEGSEKKLPILADFYVGVVELFAVMLPGVIFAFLLITCLPPDIYLPTGRIPLTGTAGWLAFAIGAYALGHVLFALAAFALDPVYHVVYKNRGEAFNELHKRVYIQLETLVEFKRDTGDDALDWTLAILSLRAPGAIAQLDHRDADSKFLRSLVPRCSLAGR
jgi:hypothetical protein